MTRNWCSTFALTDALSLSIFSTILIMPLFLIARRWLGFIARYQAAFMCSVSSRLSTPMYPESPKTASFFYVNLHTKERIFYFMVQTMAANGAATLYSLLGTAKLNGINPQTYLTHVLTVIADHKVNQISELLPWYVKLEKVTQVESETETA